MVIVNGHSSWLYKLTVMVYIVVVIVISYNYIQAQWRRLDGKSAMPLA